jgi:hypothetical protein
MPSRHRTSVRSARRPLPCVRYGRDVLMNLLRFPSRATLLRGPTVAWPFRTSPAAAWARFRWLQAPVAIAIAGRVYSTLLLAGVALHRHEHLVGPVSVTGRWDAHWYFEIAVSGYHVVPIQPSALGGHHDYAFFPLWPIALRLGSLGGVLPVAVVGVILAPLLAIAAAAVIAVVLDRAFGRSAAIGGVALLSFSPAAYVLSMAYSEPLFLLCAGLALASTPPVRRGLFVALAMLTRIAGAALVAAEGLQVIASRGRDRGALIAAAGGALAFAAWWLVVAAITGTPTGFLEGSPAWAATTGWRQVVSILGGHDRARLAQLAFAGIVLLGAVLALRRDRRLGVYAVGSVLLGLLPGGYVGSFPRYVLAAFPAYAGLSSVAGRRGTMLLTVVGAVLQIVFVSFALVRVHPLPP